MSKKNIKLDTEIDAGEFFSALFSILFVIIVAGVAIFFFTKTYNPEEAKLIKGTKYAFLKLQKEAVDLFEEEKFIFKHDDPNDMTYCIRLAKKYAKMGSFNCNPTKLGAPYKNFTFKGTNIEVWGLEKPPFNANGFLVKDVLIDVDSEKGENKVGSDRFVLRIYSSNTNAGMITPVNCKIDDEKKWDLRRSLYCAGGAEIDFLTVNKPLGFNIMQIGGDKGKTQKINSNVPFLRADCLAFGGAMTGSEDYCDDSMLYWLNACSDELYCHITLAM